MDHLPSAIIKIARPLHWIKNLSLFAALMFTGGFASQTLLNRVILAFISFCFISSATYILNDILDAKRDRLHPFKKKRPIASKKLPVGIAIVEAFVFVILSLLIATQLQHPLFVYSIVVYLLIQISYSLLLKHIPTIDILIIATGFVIRVYAGAFVIDAHLSVWFLLCVISVALFLASGKRRAELNISQKSGSTRKSLSGYDKELLNSYVTMFGNAAWMSWALFTFFESPPVTLPVWLFFAELSKTTTISKLLMSTIPVVIFSVMRYQGLIFQGKGEAPEKILLTDVSLMTSVIAWFSMVVWILYFAGGILSF